jgi:hypothetical protein
MIKKIFFFCLVLLGSFYTLQARTVTAEASFTLKKTDYEIIEMPSVFDGQRVLLVNYQISEDSKILLRLFYPMARRGVSEVIHPAYFDLKTRSIVSAPLTLDRRVAIDMNDKGFVCGYIPYETTGTTNFIWSTKDNSIEYFRCGQVVKILNDNSCFTKDGWKIDKDGNGQKLVGSCSTFANRDGTYPTDERLEKIKKTIGCPICVAACSSNQELVVFEHGSGYGHTNYYQVDAKDNIKSLKSPLGGRSTYKAYLINNHNVIGGSATFLDQMGQEKELAVIWSNGSVFILNDIFGGNYEAVYSLNNRGDMMVRAAKDLSSSEKIYVFLKK